MLLTISNFHGEFMGYNEAQKKQINFARGEYKTIFSTDEVPEELQETSVKKLIFFNTITARNAPDEITFNVDTWLTRLNDRNGHLRIYAENLLRIICDWQKKEYDKFFFNKVDTWHPISSVLYEMSNWAVKTLSVASCITFETEVKNRIKYIKSLERCPHFSINEKNIFFQIRNELERNVLRHIIKEIAQSSAFQDLDQLYSASEKLLIHGVQYLFYILKDKNDNIQNCTIENLRSPSKGSPLESALKKYPGKWLKLLVSSLAFSEAVPQGNNNRANVDIKINQNSFIQMDDSAFNMTIDELKVKVSIDEISKKSDIYEEFINESCIQNFILLLGLLEELAKFLYFCRILQKLAGFGGDALIYGVSSRPVKKAMIAYIHLIENISEFLSKLHDLCEDSYGDLLSKGKNSNWLENFNHASTLHEQVQNDLTLARQWTNAVYQKALIGITPEKISEAEKDSAYIFKFAEGFSLRILTWSGFQTNAVPPQMVDDYKKMLLTFNQNERDIEDKFNSIVTRKPQHTQHVNVKDKENVSDAASYIPVIGGREPNNINQPRASTNVSNPATYNENNFAAKQPK